MEHSFCVEIAERYGERAALIIKHIDYWLTKNKADEKNFFEDRYWTYFSASEVMKIFPYIKERQFRYTVSKLEGEVLRLGNFNKKAYDKTTWYTFTDEFLIKYGAHLAYCSMQLSFLSDLKKEKKPTKEKKKPTFAEDSTEYKAAKYFFLLLEKNNPDQKFKAPNFQSWAKDIDLILRKDQRDKDELRGLMEWVVTEPFWRLNVLSPAKLRIQYDKLLIKKKSETRTITKTTAENEEIKKIRDLQKDA